MKRKFLGIATAVLLSSCGAVSTNNNSNKADSLPHVVEQYYEGETKSQDLDNESKIIVDFLKSKQIVRYCLFSKNQTY